MKFLIEEQTVGTLINRAIENGDVVVCERCGILTLAEEMYGSVCHDCANDLIEDGLAREQEEIDEFDAIMEDLIRKSIEDSMVELQARFGNDFFEDSFF